MLKLIININISKLKIYLVYSIICGKITYFAADKAEESFKTYIVLSSTIRIYLPQV